MSVYTMKWILLNVFSATAPLEVVKTGQAKHILDPVYPFI